MDLAYEQNKVRMSRAALDLLQTCKEALSDFRFIERQSPDNSFQASILLLEAAIKKAEARGEVEP